MRAFLTIVSDQSARFISFNHRCRRFFVWQWHQVCLKISNWSLYKHRFLHPTSQQDDILSSLCSQICTGLNWPPFFALFCLQLALWCNCDVGPKRVYNDKDTEKRYHWNHFLNDFFFQLMNDKIIDTQSESILLSGAREFKAADACALRINRQYCPLVWTLISLSL